MACPATITSSLWIISQRQAFTGLAMSTSSMLVSTCPAFPQLNYPSKDKHLHRRICRKYARSRLIRSFSFSLRLRSRWLCSRQRHLCHRHHLRCGRALRRQRHRRCLLRIRSYRPHSWLSFHCSSEGWHAPSSYSWKWRFPRLLEDI